MREVQVGSRSFAGTSHASSTCPPGAAAVKTTSACQYISGQPKESGVSEFPHGVSPLQAAAGGGGTATWLRHRSCCNHERYPSQCGHSGRSWNSWRRQNPMALCCSSPNRPTSTCLGSHGAITGRSSSTKSPRRTAGMDVFFLPREHQWLADQLEAVPWRKTTWCG